MKLKMEEILQLNYELNGMVITKDGVQEELSKGLLKQKTSMKNKLYFQRLNKLVQGEVKIFEDAQKELFKSFGEEKDGEVVIPTEKIEEFNKEYKEVLASEIEINPSTLWSSNLTIEDLSSIETEEIYPVFMKLVDQE
jgi:hypothetical protein